MTGTPTSQRTAPPRRFENYVLTRVVDSSVSVTDVADTAFTQLAGPTDYTGFNIGQGFCDDGLSNVTPIGFDFQLDGITYKQFVATTNGWLALVDPFSGSFAQTEVVATSTYAQYKNPTILATFGSNAVLLAPWFDDLRNVADVASKLQLSPTSFSTTKTDRISQGLEPRPTQLNQVAYGVSMFNDVRSRRGRRLIVRWNSLSNYVAPSTVLKFEVVLYENGTIEYRYVPRSAIVASPSTQIEGATVGIFMPNGTNRFRDFAVGLGYRDNDRAESTLGGFTYSSAYTDTKVDAGTHGYTLSASYTVNLQPYSNWPGGAAGGSVFTFSPPVNRRRVLPRTELRKRDGAINLPLVARTGDSRLGTSLSGFDDRRSLTYSSTLSGSAGYVPGSAGVVNFPTTLKRSFGGTAPGTFERQNLFTGDFLVTSSVSRAAAERYTEEQPERSIEAFSEASRYDQQGPANVVTSSFFQFGTDPYYVGQGLDQRLKSKTQVRFSLNVTVQTSMPGTTSSIYYYNARTRAWNVPENSTYTLAAGGTSPPSPPTPAGGDWRNAAKDAGSTKQLVIEDARGFGAFGQAIGSGSNNVGGFSSQTDALMGFTSLYTPQVGISAMQRVLAKSVRNNKEYRPAPDETFTLPITAPFLIEKAVIELPFAAGPGWFNDSTRTFSPVGSTVLGFPFSSFDVAGPALTVALMRQVQEAESSDYPSRRDLILTGTFTHANDYVSGVALDTAPPTDTIWHVNPKGFLSYANPAAGLVFPTAAGGFTGSVQLTCEAMSSAGLTVFYHNYMSDTAANVAASIKHLLTLPVLPLTSTYLPGSALYTFVSHVSPLGRGGTGFAPSGRSVFGNETVTYQGLSDPTARTVPNPFYVGPAGLTAQQHAVLDGPVANLTASMASAAVPLYSHLPSPYLVLPGDKLVLSISKMRPYVFTGTGASSFSGSLHDVTLMPGAINITLYGSLLQEGVEFHDTLNQPLGSDAVHELIGAEPVLDQFDVPYRFELSGSYTDNVVTGSLVSLQSLNTVLHTVQPGGSVTNVTLKSTSLVTGSRGRAYSKLTADSCSPPQLNTPANSVAGPYVQAQFDFPSKASRLVPNHERAGDPRLLALTDTVERWYDSMMPSVVDAFAADGCGIFIPQPDIEVDDFGNPYSIGGLGIISASQGFIFFDNLNLPAVDAGFGPISNKKWTKSFPFEPRYSAATRQQNIARSFLAIFAYINATTVVPIPPTPVNGFLFGPSGYGFTAFSLGGSSYQFLDTVITNHWLADANVSTAVTGSDGKAFVTGSAQTDDAVRGLFGFGDYNNYRTWANFDGTTSLVGTGHFAGSRDQHGPHPYESTVYNPSSDSNTYHFSPVIRGWKYGVISGLPLNTRAYWRRGRFGQFRDMLEQRPFGTMYNSVPLTPTSVNALGTTFFQLQAQPPPGTQLGLQPSVVEVRFVESLSGNTTSPENTWSSNLDMHCTSSLPYFDGVTTNRGPINLGLLNKQVSTISSDTRGNVSL